ncbi:TonB-dependent receptor plug domain-containing protein [Aliikangiella sp. IMCC44359]|uniref:TonB-dependent receptor plug domain-containing protein n=1 Tax=Aliikangiella sp. IMCC44359 TaxID=3459125 RepID=UPI00403B2EEA
MNKFNKRDVIAKAVRTVLLAGTTASMLSVPSLYAAEEDETASGNKDTKIVVTGSRITRSDAETALPVTVISREDLEMTGDISVAEVLRDLPYATTGSFFGTTSSWGNVANTDLRGLGGGRTLYLIDGIRVAGAGTTGAQIANANMIPISAVEEIHVLREGASSIYGSDAIGGVINIITRTDYDGANLSISAGKPAEGNADESDVKLTYGFSSDKTSGIVTFGHTEYGGIKGGEREHLRNAPDEPYGDYAAQWYGPYGTWRPTGALSAGSTFQPRWNPGPDCPTEQIDTESSSISNYCYHNVWDGKDYYPSFETNTIFTNVRRELNESMSVWTRASYYAYDQSGEFTDLWFYGTMGATNPNNPTFGTADQQDIIVLQGLAGVAPRRTEYASTDINFAVGYDWLTDMGELSAYASKSRNRSDIKTDSYVITDTIQAAVDSGDFNPFIPGGGPNATDEVLASFLHTATRLAWSESESLGLNWSADTEVELGGGVLAYAVGFEHRVEKYSDTQDKQTNAGNVLGSFGGDSIGDRNSHAFFAEVNLPILEELEVNLSTRNDTYSKPDTSAQTSALKISYRPIDDILVRASYSEGFRAPALDDLLGSPAVSYDSVYDPSVCFPAIEAAMASDSEGRSRGYWISQLAECDTEQQLRVSEGNRDLKPEDSTQKSIGIVYQVTEEFNFALDYYDIEITNQVSYISAQSVLNLEYNNQLSPFPKCFVTRDNVGEVEQITACNANADGITTKGLDFDFGYKLDMADAGILRFKLIGSKAIEWTSKQSPVSPRYDWVGFKGVPELRYTFNTVWEYDNLSLALSYNHVADMRGEDADLPEFEQGDFDEFNTFDLNARYTTDYGIFTLGARNLTDEMPTLNREEISFPGFDRSNHDIAGRVVYARYSIDF